MVLALVTAVSAPGKAPASDGKLTWPKENYDYVIVDQKLEEVLAEFGKNLGVKLQISEEIEGRVRGEWPKLQPKRFLEALAQRFGFDWYFDGHILHITATPEAQSRLLFLGRVPFEELRRNLADLDLLDPRYLLRFNAGSNLALVAGPPRYIEMVEETLAALNSRTSAKIFVFRGRAAPTP